MNYQFELLEKYRREILYRFNVTFVVVFLLGFIVYSMMYFQKEKNDDWDAVSYTVKEAVTLYFDSLSTLMLTGTMEHKEIIRKKMLSRSNVVDVRLIRNSTIFKLTTADQQPKDELEKKALKSKADSIVEVDENNRILSVGVPMRATENTRGVNCLVCHNVPSGEVLGVIRLDYSLADSDKKTMEEFFNSIVFMIIIFIVALLVANIYIAQRRD